MVGMIAAIYYESARRIWPQSPRIAIFSALLGHFLTNDSEHDSELSHPYNTI